VAFPPGVIIDGRPFSYGRLSEKRLRSKLDHDDFSISSPITSSTAISNAASPQSTTFHQGFQRSSRLSPVKLDGPGGPLALHRRITMRIVVRVIVAAVGLAIFLFGRIGAATGSALPLMQYHVIFQILGLLIASCGLLVGLRRRSHSS